MTVNQLRRAPFSPGSPLERGEPEELVFSHTFWSCFFKKLIVKGTSWLHLGLLKLFSFVSRVGGKMGKHLYPVVVSLPSVCEALAVGLFSGILLPDPTFCLPTAMRTSGELT